MELTTKEVLRGVIGSVSTRNDYLNTVFYEVVSLRELCKNNALSRSLGHLFEIVVLAWTIKGKA